jgi:hypothetical protein
MPGPLPEVAKEHGASAQKIYSRRKHFDTLAPAGLRRLPQAEQVNGRVKKLIGGRDLEPPVVSIAGSAARTSAEFRRRRSARARWDRYRAGRGEQAPIHHARLPIAETSFLAGAASVCAADLDAERSHGAGGQARSPESGLAKREAEGDLVDFTKRAS